MNYANDFCQSVIKILIGFLVLTLVACGESVPAQAEQAEKQVSESPGTGKSPDTHSNVRREENPTLSATERLEKSIAELESQIDIDVFKEPWTGDLDVMADQRLIRVLTVYGLGRYFMDGPSKRALFTRCSGCMRTL